MCLDFLFGGGKSKDDGGAAAARAAEQARQAAIRTGTENVNKTFSQFDDNFFGGISKAHADFYGPQIEKQYHDARRDLVLKLGQSGILNSTGGQRKLSDLDLAAARQRSSIADQGLSLAADARNRVEDSRSNILAQLTASADPTAAATAAAARAKSLTAPPAFSPLANLFSSFADLGTSAVIGAAHRGETGPSLFGAKKGGSATVVA